MYDTILVPIDLSDRTKADRMIAVARTLANPGARIVLTHVVEDIPAYIVNDLPAGTLDRSRAEAQRSMEEIAAEAGVPVEVDVRVGHAATSILDSAQETGAGVIVIASHRPGLRDYLIGSTAGRVVRHARCAVFVLR